MADLGTRALSAAYGGGPFSGVFFPAGKMLFPSRNFHFGRPKTNFKKWREKKKKKKVVCHPASYATGALWPSCLRRLFIFIFLCFVFCLFVCFFFYFLFFWWGPWEQYFRGAMSAAADTADSKIRHWNRHWTTRSSDMGKCGVLFQQNKQDLDQYLLPKSDCLLIYKLKYGRYEVPLWI